MNRLAPVLDALSDNCIGRFSVPVWRVGQRGPLGAPLAASEGQIGVHPVAITVTDAEEHIRVLSRNEAFALDLQAVVQAAFDLVETAIDAAFHVFGPSGWVSMPRISRTR